jgi:hypothetical protein
VIGPAQPELDRLARALAALLATWWLQQARQTEAQGAYSVSAIGMCGGER